MKKHINIAEVIVVEGKDDTAKLKEIVGINTIETHGYGITEKKWQELEKAYKEIGIIIFTDPDHAGNQIRKKLKQRFPLAKEAFLSREKASSGVNIGIENAKIDDIIEALEKAKELWCDEEEKKVKQETEKLSMEDMIEIKLIGDKNSRERRKYISDIFGFGYSNAKKTLEKINLYNIGKEKISLEINKFEKR